MKRFVLFGILLFACILLNAAGLVVNSSITDLQLANLRSCAYDVNINNQVAVVTVTETFINSGGSNMAPRYYFPMPDGASATQLRWLSNGVWYTAFISPNPQNPPGGPTNLPEYFTNYVGRFPIIFDFTTVLAPGSTLQVELTYVQLLPYSMGNVDLILKNNISSVQTQSLETQSLDVSLTSDRTITSFTSINHNTESISNTGETASAHISLSYATANMDYHLRYSLSSDQLGLWAMSTVFDSVPDNLGRGFFTFIAEPDASDNSQVINKVFTLVIDRSGSMGWNNKMAQAKNAATYIVNHLNEGDLFNIVIFNHLNQSLWNTHQPGTPANVSTALNFINNITATGNTDIESAFNVAVPQFVNASLNTANIIIFLTDGQPTSGITNTTQLVSYVDGLMDSNPANIFLFNFGIGSDVNQQLLSQLAAHNSGLATFLGDNEVYATITDFYNMIRNPVMLDPTFTVNPPGSVSEVFPSDLPNLYQGKQMVVSGRYNIPQNTIITFTGRAFNQQVTYQYQLNLTETPNSDYSFLPKIWAQQKLEELIAQYYTLDPFSMAAIELKQTIVDISVTWGVITEFTSFSGGVGTDDNTEETPSIAEVIHLNNFPNPFNPTTTFSFDVVKDIRGPAIVKIYNSKGQLIRTLGVNIKGKGKYQIFWDGKDQNGQTVTSGIYYYSLIVGNSILTNKMSIMK